MISRVIIHHPIDFLSGRAALALRHADCIPGKRESIFQCFSKIGRTGQPQGGYHLWHARPECHGSILHDSAIPCRLRVSRDISPPKYNEPFQSIYDAVFPYDKAKVVEEVRKELAAGTDVSEILSKGLIAPLEEVGEKFSKGSIFIPEMLTAAVTMKEDLGIVKPILSETKSNRNWQRIRSMPAPNAFM